jgi:hypothetical protein
MLPLVGLTVGCHFQYANFNAPILRTALFILIVRNRIFLTQTHDRNSEGWDFLGDQIPFNGFSAPLAEAHIVLFGTTRIGISLEFNHVSGASDTPGNFIKRAFRLRVQNSRIKWKRDNLLIALDVIVVRPEIIKPGFQSVNSVVCCLHALISRVSLPVSRLSGTLSRLRCGSSLSRLLVGSCSGSYSLLSASVNGINPFRILFNAILSFLN